MFTQSQNRLSNKQVHCSFSPRRLADWNSQSAHKLPCVCVIEFDIADEIWIEGSSKFLACSADDKNDCGPSLVKMVCAPSVCACDFLSCALLFMGVIYNSGEKLLAHTWVFIFYIINPRPSFGQRSLIVTRADESANLQIKHHYGAGTRQ